MDVGHTMERKPPHPLWGAELRVARARTHITSLDRHIKRWTESHYEYIETQWHPDEGLKWRLRDDIPVELLWRSGIWIGEVAYNLRAALDYLVYEIACAGNDGQHVRNTQFPICSRMEDFRLQAYGGKNPKTGRRIESRLRHVPQAVIDRFRELQPAPPSNCVWTGLLRDLSNPDKHWHTQSLTSNAQLLALDGAAEQPARHHQLVVRVFFQDPPLEVIESLKLLHRETRSLVQEFKPAFKRVS